MTTRICKTCNTELDLSCFYQNKHQSSGYNYRCKSCTSLYEKERYQRNKEAILARNRQWTEKNRDRHYALNRTWHEENREHALIKAREYRQANKAKGAAKTARRRTKVLQATPAWNDKERMQAYYDVCAFFNEVNGYIKYHVDHIVPLNGKNVCGLHVHNNLQVLPAHENMSKSNKM